MVLTLEEIERLHDEGLMPDRYYYQCNGKSATENYREIKRKQRAWIQELLERQYSVERERRQKIEQKKAEKELEKEIEAKTEKAIEKALNDLLKDFLK